MCLFDLPVTLSLLLFDPLERAKRQPISFWGNKSLCWRNMLILLRLGGVPLMGGPDWSLGIKVPRGDSSGEGRAAHGPLHPAVNRFLETLMVPLFFSLLWSWFCHLVACIAFFCLWGWSFVWSLSPSSPDPCLFFLYVSLFFSLVWLVSSTPCSLFLSLSLRCWGNPNRFGLGFPLCSLPPAHVLRPRPVLRVPHLHLGEAPAPAVFSFFRRRRSFSGSGVSRFCPGGVGFFSWFVLWWWVSVCILRRC